MSGWRSGWLMAGIVAAGLIAALLDGDAGLRTWWTLRADVREARERIAALREAVATLERKAAVLEDDSFALERAIRERLEYARPGETVVRLRARDDANHRIP